MTNRSSSRYLIVLFAAVLLVGVTVVLAGGPAAPAGQDEKPPAQTEPTPTPTPTPVTSQDDLPGLEGLLRARVAEYETAQSSSNGAWGVPQRQKWLM